MSKNAKSTRIFSNFAGNPSLQIGQFVLLIFQLALQFQVFGFHVFKGNFQLRLH